MARWCRIISRFLLASFFVLAWMAPAPASAGTYQVTEESDWYFTIDQDDTLVVIYGNSNEECESVTTDPYLWLYDDQDVLIVSDDDGNHGQGQCVSSKIYTTLNAGVYRLRAGYCCSQLGLGNTTDWGDGTYELVVDLSLETDTTSSTSTTTTITTTTTSSTSTTTTTTTTTIAPWPSTTSSSTTTSTTQPSTTTTTTSTLPPTTTTTLSPTTTSSSTTTVAPTSTTTTTTTSTTLPPISTTTTSPPSTTSSTTPSTTVLVAPTTSTSTSTSTTTTTPTSTSTTTTTVPPATSSTSTTISTTTTEPVIPLEADTPEKVAEAVVEALIENPTKEELAQIVEVLNEADDETKKAIEASVNIFDSGLEDYVPSGSTVTVAQRRAIIAGTTVIIVVPSVPSGPRSARSRK